jgi:hypothetical protein
MARSPSDKDDGLDEARRIMGALVRMPPKPHEDMKLGKPKTKKAKSPAKAGKAKKGKLGK